MKEGLDDAAIDALSEAAARFTGFSRDAILPDAIRRAAAGLLRAGHAEPLDVRAARGDRDVVHALCQAVSVGETYFFRHPEHFRFVATFLRDALQSGRSTLRAWSAGCATGEEAYSIAACLLDLLPWPRTVAVDVLGTDLLERNLVAARAGVYGTWSRRPSGPMLHPVFRQGDGERVPVDEERVSVDDRVRAVTSFREHNLLDPMDEKFDLIFCRNVLVYFSPDAVRTAVAHLARALHPGGALLFGSMDLAEPPAGLVSAGLPELQAYRKPGPKAAAAAKKAAKPAPQPIETPPYVPRVRPPEPVALHLKALVHIERGDRKVAERELADLTQKVPDYVPGILERALLHVRQGERSAAESLMREVLRRTDRLPEDELVAGPEPLPVRFYRDSAQTFLRSARGGIA